MLRRLVQNSKSNCIGQNSDNPTELGGLNHMRMDFWQWICWSNTFYKHMCSNWCAMLWFIHYLIRVIFTIIALLLTHTSWKILCSLLTSIGLSHLLLLWQIVIFPPRTTAKCDHSTNYTISEILWPSHLITTICLLSNLLSITHQKNKVLEDYLLIYLWP